MSNNRQMKKSPFAILNIFKPKRPNRRVEDYSRDEYYSSTKAYKVWPSDEDRGLYVGDPSIDKKASAYITEYFAANQNVVEHDLR
ncbi:hypothetical protein HYC85_001986 [Camellia sinensis]|uniref:Uncharacterized protein n=1 Tax=Camellia sinensis TaxID=4442 RepID=A0A7J7I8C4_CAMSI|nr:hypothetical protein HYC85_001986 [Camellia sinensis]